MSLTIPVYVTYADVYSKLRTSCIVFCDPQFNKGMLFSLLSDTKLILPLYILPLVVFLRPFDEGLPIGQSRAAIDLSGSQNDGEIAQRYVTLLFFLLSDTKLILSLYIQPLVVFLRHFDEGFPSGQSKVAIDLSGSQNDGEIAQRYVTLLSSLFSNTNLALSLYIQPLIVFLTNFDEGSLSGQSRVAIDPSGT
jgi:hypothetical protein